jgi:hypothetical protein
MKFLALTVFSLAAGVAELASAQTLVVPAPRQGYYLGGGVRQAAGSMISSTAGNLGFFQGGAFTLRLGQMAGQEFGFGLVLSSGGGQNDDWTGGYGALQIEAQYVFFENLAFRGGVGVGGLGVGRVKPEDEREDDPSGTFGSLYTLGFSYDWFPWWERADGSGGFAFTVYIEGYLLPGDDLAAFGALAGIEVNYWFGIDDHKLDLPPEEAFEDD